MKRWTHNHAEWDGAAAIRSLAHEVQDSRPYTAALEREVARMASTIADLRRPWRTRGDDGQEYEVVAVASTAGCRGHHHLRPVRAASPAATWADEPADLMTDAEAVETIEALRDPEKVSLHEAGQDARSVLAALSEAAGGDDFAIVDGVLWQVEQETLGGAALDDPTLSAHLIYIRRPSEEATGAE